MVATAGSFCAAVPEAGGVHAPRPLARCSLAVRIAVGHDNNHRFCLAHGNEVVENLCGATEFAPGILVTACSVQQIQHGVLAALVIAWRGVDGHAALHLERRAVVPHLGQVAVGHLVHTVQVTLVALLFADDKDVGKRYNIAVHIDVGRVFHPRHAIDVERVTVHLRGQLAGGVSPYAIRPLGQCSHSGGIITAATGNLDCARGQEVTGHLHLDGLGSKQVEGHCAVGVDDGRLNVGTIKKFLLCRGTHAAHGRKRHHHDYSFHTITIFLNCYPFNRCSCTSGLSTLSTLASCPP